MKNTANIRYEDLNRAAPNSSQSIPIDIPYESKNILYQNEIRTEISKKKYLG